MSNVLREKKIDTHTISDADILSGEIDVLEDGSRHVYFGLGHRLNGGTVIFSLKDLEKIVMEMKAL